MAFSTMIVGKDATPPSQPSSPTASSISGTGVTLNWVPASDNVGVAGYNISRNGVVVARLAVPPYYDTGLTPGLSYTYNLSAFDAEGNVSGQSPALRVTTINTAPPTVPENLTAAGITQSSITLTWGLSTDPGGVGGYRVLRGASPSTLEIVAPEVSGTSYLDNHLTPSAAYYYAVEAYNSIGLNSMPSATIGATTLALPAPANPKVISVSTRSVSLSWSASGGTDAPVGYRVLRGTTRSSLAILVPKNPGTAYMDQAVIAGSTYYYEVEMIDSLGHSSGPSNILTVAVPR
jgi:fibronectin type 3 domain-containing protein